MPAPAAPRLDCSLAAIASLFAPALLLSHPDHTVTQKGVIEPVPANQAAPADATVSISVEGDKRVIVSNGLPDHATGRFPNRDNPNRIAAQSYRFTVPLKPAPAPNPIRYGNQLFGVAVNGVVFDPATAEAWQNDRRSGWSYDAKGGAFSLGLDTSNGHVQPNGAYHYHGIPTALLKRLGGAKPSPVLLGWAADGYPIIGKWGHRSAKDSASPVVELRSSYRLKKGDRPTSDGQPGGAYDGVFVEDFEYIAGSGDLDECSGRFGVIPGFPQGTYHYVLTEDFPFIPRLLRGTPDPSFLRRGGGAPPGRDQPGARAPGPPPPPS